MKSINFSDFKKSLTRISEDTHNKKSMVCSDFQIVDFDDVKGRFLSKLGSRDAKGLKSNDGFYEIPDEVNYFIEFKNGDLQEGNKSIEGDLRQKNYDSVSILSTIKGQCIETIKNKTEYILVYNSEKYKENYRKMTVDPVKKKAKTTIRPILNLDFFEGFLFRKVHTITAEQFEKNFLDKWNGTIE